MRSLLIRASVLEVCSFTPMPSRDAGAAFLVGRIALYTIILNYIIIE